MDTAHTVVTVTPLQGNPKVTRCGKFIMPGHGPDYLLMRSVGVGSARGRRFAGF